MIKFSDKELETTFIQTRLEEGIGFDAAWAAWFDFHAKVQFIAAQPFLPLCGAWDGEFLTREERFQMRRDARLAIGKHVRINDVDRLAAAARCLGVVAPARKPSISCDLMEVIAEVTSYDHSECTSEFPPPMPKVDALMIRLQLACPEAEFFHRASPYYLAVFFLSYVLVHDLGNVPFETQAGLFAGRLKEFAERNGGVTTLTRKDLQKFLDSPNDAD